MKRILLFTCIVMLSKYAFTQDSTASKLDQLITAYADLNRFNGSALVAMHGKILLQKGYGLQNAAGGKLNDENTIYQIASVTKRFTATVILKLVEQKKMLLTDKLSKYYSGFPNGDSITIENLLTHTSGMHNFTEEDTVITETDERRMVPYLKTLKPDFAPGTSWSYSNSGYVMLGYIIQKVSGLTYWQAVRTYIFQPLNMNNSGFDFTHLTSTKKAVGYDVLNDTLKQPAVLADSTVPFGAGAVYSTVKDLYNWHIGLQAYKVVNKALMQQAYTPCARHNYGYGWQIDSVAGKKVVSHSGSINGFGSNFARVESDDVCIVLLSNKSGSTFDVVHLTDKLFAILYHQLYTVPVKRKPFVIRHNILQKYTGTYAIAEMNLTIDITTGDGILIAHPNRDGHPGPTSFLRAINNLHFYDEHDEELEVSFDADTIGKVNGMEILQMGTKRYAKKIK